MVHSNSGSVTPFFSNEFLRLISLNATQNQTFCLFAVCRARHVDAILIIIIRKRNTKNRLKRTTFWSHILGQNNQVRLQYKIIDLIEFPRAPSSFTIMNSYKELRVPVCGTLSNIANTKAFRSLIILSSLATPDNANIKKSAIYVLS